MVVVMVVVVLVMMVVNGGSSGSGLFIIQLIHNGYSNRTIELVHV